MENNQTIVDDHRNMLMLTKKVSDFQENNLKSWAFVFFDNVDSVNVSWNFLKNNSNEEFFPGDVEFNIIFNNNTLENLDKEQKGLNMLIAATKFLFWSETNIVVKKNGVLWTNN